MHKEYKHVEMELSYKVYRKNVKVTVERKAGVEFGAETDFAQIAEFLKDVKKVIQGFKYCAKNGVFCKVYLSSAIYDVVDGPESLKSRSFNGWQFEDVPMSGDGEGMYLSPDTRYTVESHDIWIDFAQPLLGQLAQAHI